MKTIKKITKLLNKIKKELNLPDITIEINEIEFALSKNNIRLVSGYFVNSKNEIKIKMVDKKRTRKFEILDTFKQAKKVILRNVAYSLEVLELNKIKENFKNQLNETDYIVENYNVYYCDEDGFSLYPKNNFKSKFYIEIEVTKNEIKTEIVLKDEETQAIIEEFKKVSEIVKN